ncbi:MAG: GDP-mannose 4,6-dehydratase, partial [Candidatus Omnitrophota bacterium]
MKILITGGAGFIGSHLCDFLIGKGHKVICMDNLITGKKENIAHLLRNKNFKFINHNVSEHIHLNESIGYVLHFASPASPVDYHKYPIQTLKVGSLGTHNALGLAKAKKAKFLLASTSEVYGDPLVNPQPEEYWGNVNPVGVRGCFSEDTEILTKNGWKFFPQLKMGQEVATLNKEGYIEYHKPTDFIKERYVGELIRFSNYKIDLLVTPNHKMYVRRRSSDGFHLVEAFECIRWDRTEMLKSAKWNGGKEEWFHLPLVRNAKSKQQEKIRMDLWLEFFGYFITEGSTYLRHRKQ